MKAQTIAVALGVWFVAVAVSLAGDSAQMGTWKLDEAKSDIPAGAQKNSTVIYASQGDNVKVTVEGTRDGKAVNTTWVGKFDGKGYKVSGSPVFDEIAYTKVDDRTNEMKATKDGKLVANGRIEVAADGKSRTVTIDATDASGKKQKTKAVYTKQ